MTSIDMSSNTFFFREKDMFDLFSGIGVAGFSRTIGVEGEFPVVSLDALKYANSQEVLDLRAELLASGGAFHTEAAGVIEYASDPFVVNKLDDIVACAGQAEFLMANVAVKQGMMILPTSVPPFTTLQEAESKLIGRDRVRDMAQTVREALPLDALRVGFLTASTQVSLTYSDLDDLYRILHRGYALSPLLVALFASDTGRAEGIKYSEHIRSVFYRAYSTFENGIPSYLRASNDGEGLISSHINDVRSAPMLYYYDLEGRMHRGKEVGGPALTFNHLAKRGLNTEKNFYLAESFLYPDIKFKPLPNGHRRLEFRTPDSGPGYMGAVVTMIGAILANEDVGRKFDRILSKYGFLGSFPDDYLYMLNSRFDAARFPGRLDLMSFGVGSMQEFHCDISRLLMEVLNESGPAKEAVMPFLSEEYIPLTVLYRSKSDEDVVRALKPKI